MRAENVLKLSSRSEKRADINLRLIHNLSLFMGTLGSVFQGINSVIRVISLKLGKLRISKHLASLQDLESRPGRYLKVKDCTII